MSNIDPNQTAANNTITAALANRPVTVTVLTSALIGAIGYVYASIGTTNTTIATNTAAATAALAALPTTLRVPLPANPTLAQVINYTTYVDPYILPTDPDATAGIQRALTAAGYNGHVVFQCHDYNVSGTVTGLYNQTIEGCADRGTRLVRSADYGDTLVVGSSTGTYPSYAAGAFSLRHMEFVQQGSYASTATSGSVSNLTTKGSHIHLFRGQGCTIEDVWMTRLPYGLNLDTGVKGINDPLGPSNTICNIIRVKYQGVWDLDYAAAQEGVAGIYLGPGSTSIRIQIANLDGFFTAQRTVAYVGDNGTTNNTQVKNAGPLNQILVAGCEDCEVGDSIIEKGALNGIGFAVPAGGVCLDIRIHDNHMDGSGTASNGDISFNNGAACRGITISGNDFDGELAAMHAINLQPLTGNSSSPGTIQTTIIGNNFYAYVGTPIFSYASNKTAISGNTIAYYNILNITGLAYMTGVLGTSSATTNLSVTGNILCGDSAGTAYGVFGATLQANNTNAGCKTALSN